MERCNDLRIVRAAMGDMYKALADPTRGTILDERTERDAQTLFELCSRLASKHQLGSSRHTEASVPVGPPSTTPSRPLQAPAA
jgi:hypothetical protein